MNKEELENEAEVCMHNALFWLKLPISKENVEKGGSYILKLLEPREKQIEIDAKQIRALQKQNGELTDKVKELEAQIEKMQEKLKADLIAKLEEQIQYSTSPSCTKGMELFIKSIEKWEIKEK